MFFEQTNEYTITADASQWILIWHPKGPVHRVQRDGTQARLPKGDQTFYPSIRALAAAVLDKKARRCKDMADLSSKLEALAKETRRICSLEGVGGG